MRGLRTRSETLPSARDGGSCAVVIVIGSGPAGVSCAKALMGRGVEVSLLDAGLELEPERRALVDELARQAPPGMAAGAARGGPPPAPGEPGRGAPQVQLRLGVSLSGRRAPASLREPRLCDATHAGPRRLQHGLGLRRPPVPRRGSRRLADRGRGSRPALPRRDRLDADRGRIGRPRRRAAAPRRSPPPARAERPGPRAAGRPRGRGGRSWSARGCASGAHAWRCGPRRTLAGPAASTARCACTAAPTA